MAKINKVVSTVWYDRENYHALRNLFLNSEFINSSTVDTSSNTSALGGVVDDVDCLFLFHAVTVRTHFGDRGENIRNSHDPGSQIQLVRGEMEWIAMTIQLFVVESGPVCDFPKSDNVFQHIACVICVFFNDVEFFVCEFSGLLKNLSRHHQFSYIMQISGNLHFDDIIW